jgi:hypothetical protein
MNEPEKKPSPSAIAPGEVVGFLALAITLIALLWIVQKYLHGLGERADVGAASVADTLAKVRLIVMFSAVLVLASAAVLGRLLWKIGKAAIDQRHFPPAGVVAIEVRSQRDGDEAMGVGRMLCQLGIAIAAIGVVAAAIGTMFALRL